MGRGLRENKTQGDAVLVLAPHRNSISSSSGADLTLSAARAAGWARAAAATEQPVLLP